MKSTTESLLPEIDLAEYQPKNPELYNFYDQNLDPWVTKFVDTSMVQGDYDLICDEPCDNVYMFPLFTEAFCRSIVTEAESFSGWTTTRHKNYPTNDMLLRSFGMNLAYSYVIRKYVYPLILNRYKYYSDQLMNQPMENFIARYKPDQQKHLACHHDGSLLSMVVTLNSDYEGGGTYFPKYKTLVRPSQPGHAILFPGLITHLHGGRPVTKGTRYIIASFIGRITL